MFFFPLVCIVLFVPLQRVSSCDSFGLVSWVSSKGCGDTAYKQLDVFISKDLFQMEKFV